MPVREMMSSWTEQKGFPLVRVVQEDWQGNKVTLELEQSFFISDGSALTEEEAAMLWTIPILTATEDGTQAEMMLMRQRKATLTVAAKNWVKLNAGQEVPIRILPSPEMLKRLSAGIRGKKVTPIDRAGIINDAYALTKAGHMTPESLLELIVNYEDEDSYVVWEGLSCVLGGINTILSNNEELSVYFENFAKDCLSRLMEKIGWDAREMDGHHVTLLRGLMVNLLSSISYDDPVVAEEAKVRVEALQKDEDESSRELLPNDLRAPVFQIYLKNGGAKEYENILEYYRNATEEVERRQVFSSIGHTPDPKLKKAVMEWSLSGAVKTQDIHLAFGSVGFSSNEGREISWEFYKENFERLKTIFRGGSPVLMTKSFANCVQGFCSNEKADEIEAFFEENPLPGSKRTISQVVENIRANAKLLDRLKQ